METAILCGSTGAGKTTITNLINRFYDIQEGTIKYDGINIKDIKKSDLRKSLTMVLQDTHLFTGTVMENVRYGKLSATDEEVKEALRIVAADEFINKLDDGSFFTLIVYNYSKIEFYSSYSDLSFITANSLIILNSINYNLIVTPKEIDFLIENSNIAIIDKRRPKPNVAEVMNIIGDVSGKIAVIIDDIVDTAGTLTIAASALKKAGATEVYAAATHGILSNPAIERISNSELEELVISDSIPLPPEKQIDKIKVLSVATMLAKAIEYIQKGSSMNVVYDLYKKKEKE